MTLNLVVTHVKLSDQRIVGNDTTGNDPVTSFYRRQMALVRVCSDVSRKIDELESEIVYYNSFTESTRVYSKRLSSYWNYSH